MNKLKRYLDDHHSLYRALEVIGIKKLSQAIRKRALNLPVNGVKKVKIVGVEMLFSLADTPSQVFFNHPFFSGELYEKEVVHHLAERLRDSSRCFVDIGANIGYYSVLAGKILATQGGVVHAIEMDVDNANRIRKNLRLNDLHNVSIHEVALGDHIGSVEYYRCGSFRNTLEVSSDEQDQYSKVSAPMTTMDLLIAEEAINPVIIKIDVEGAEYIVLQGMEKLLSDRALEIYCEVHVEETTGGLASFGHSINDVWKILERHNYRVWEIPLRKDSKQSNIRIINDVRDIVESTMLYASNVQKVENISL